MLQNCTAFVVKSGFELRVCDTRKLSSREFISEKNYWNKFYKKFTDFLYQKGCHDNYVGANIKTLRTFFNYLRSEKNIDVGDFYKSLYIRREEIEILVLSPDQLKFLIHDKKFEESLGKRLQRIKDIFIFGCSTGLRFSDIFLLRNKNFVKKEGHFYLKLKSKKTKTFSFIKLPEYVIEIYQKYKPVSNKTVVFNKISLFNFNKNLKRIGQLAGFNEPIEFSRERRGRVNSRSGKRNFLFYEKMSSHMMRRTAITTYLILGMPEHLVRNLSGHSQGSASFNKYVHYAQSYKDQEIEKVHQKLASY